MAFEYLNLNPSQKIVGDCVVRAIALATGDNWDKTYIGLSILGFLHKDVFTSNSVWGAYLMQNGFERYAIPNTCPECYSISDFAFCGRTPGRIVRFSDRHACCHCNRWDDL